MKKTEKDAIIQNITQQLENTTSFYLTDISDLNAKDTYALRKMCFEKQVNLLVVKNTLLAKALENSNKAFDGLDDVLKGHTSLMTSTDPKLPAQLIKSFRKGRKKPILKAAYVLESIYIGDNQLESLLKLKSKNELIGEVIGLLQSPIQNVLSALQSGGNTIAGIVKAIQEKKEQENN